MVCDFWSLVDDGGDEVLKWDIGGNVVKGFGEEFVYVCGYGVIGVDYFGYVCVFICWWLIVVSVRVEFGWCLDGCVRILVGWRWSEFGVVWLRVGLGI